MIRWVFFFLFLMVWATGLFGQGYPFIRFTRNEGLAGNTVYTIHQDSKGYLWVGTETGLSRYDGYSFKNYGVETGLPTNEIMGNIYEDSKGRVWFASLSKRPFYYDLNKERFFTEKEDPIIKQIPEGTEAVYEDKKGVIYFVGILKYVVGGYPSCPERWSRFIQTVNTSYKAIGRQYGNFLNHISTWEEDGNLKVIIDGGIFISSAKTCLMQDTIDIRYNSGYYRLFENGNFKKNKYALIQDGSIIIYHHHKILKSYAVNRTRQKIEHSLATDGKNYYLANTGGLWRFNPNESKEVELLNDSYANVVRTDDEGNVWCGTRGNGLYCYKNQSLSIRNWVLNPLQPNDNKVVSMSKYLTNQPSNLLLGSDKGLFYFFSDSTIKVEKTRLTGRVLGFYTLKNRFYFFGDGGVYLHNNFAGQHKFIIGSTIRSLFIMNDYWGLVGTNLTIVDTNLKSILKINKDKLYTHSCIGNYVWIGMGKGLFRINFKNKNFVDLLNESNNEFVYDYPFLNTNLKRISYNLLPLDSCLSLRKKFPQLKEEIRCLLADSTGGLCVATLSHGLLYIRGEKGWHWNEKNGMKSSAIPSVNSLSLDSLGNFWIATAGGVHRLSFVGKEKIPKMEFMFGYTEGLLSNETFCTLRQGDDLYIGTDAGLNKVSLSRFSARCVRPPKMHFTALHVQDHDYRRVIKTDFDLPYDSNRIEIEFTGLSLGRKIRYDFLVIKGDNDTIDRGSSFDRTYRLSNLAPGDYRFLVRGDSQAGCYCNYIALRWTIHPHWLFSIWGIALQVVSFLGLIGFSFLQYQRFLKKKNREKLKSLNKRIQELTLEARLAQIKPHFVSNALNAIRNKVFKQEWDAAHRYIVMFSDLARRILDSSARLEINLAEEIENLELYMGLQQLRFEDENHNPTFYFQINVTPDIIPQHYTLPTMVIQPYVENAIEHGFRYDTFTVTKRMGNLTIDFEIKDEALICTVTDNGVGRKVALKYKQELNEMKVQMGQIPRMSRGMAITEERVTSINALFYDQQPNKIEVNIIDLDDHAGNTGTQVVIHFPIEKRLG